MFYFCFCFSVCVPVLDFHVGVFNFLSSAIIWSPLPYRLVNAGLYDYKKKNSFNWFFTFPCIYYNKVYDFISLFIY